MTDSMRDLIRDELAGWHIGSGYYLTTISVDEARDMADAVLAVLTDPGEDVIERVARQLHQDDFDEDTVPHWGEITAGMRAIYRDESRRVLRAAFGGEQG